MKKKISFDFFKMKYGGTSPKSLKTIFNKEIRDFTTYYKNGKYHAFPYEPKNMNGYILGTLVVNQMDGLPSSFNNKKKTLEDLKIDFETGLAYFNSFLYDPELEILMFESNKNGCNVSTFCSVIELNIPNYNLDPRILINPSDLLKLQEMTEIKRIHVKIHNIKNGAILKKADKSVLELINFAHEVNDDYLEFSIVKSKNGTLTLQKIIDLAKSFLNFRKESSPVERLEIKGRSANDRIMRTIDLISNKLRPHIYIEKPRFFGVETINEKYKEMTSLYMKLRNEFHSAYSEE